MAIKKFKPTKDFSEFKKKYANTISDAEELAKSYGFISTGSFKLNKLLAGGLPLGQISEFSGLSHSGKTTTALSTAGAVQKSGGKVAWMDLEWALDIRPNVSYDDEAEASKSDASWLQKNGVNPFLDSFVVFQPETGEEMYEILEEIVLGHYFDYVVIDSVAAITTRAEMDGDMGESNFGQVAKLNSASLKRIMRRFGKNRSMHITMINQMRDKIGSKFGGHKTTGGNALQHYLFTKLLFRRLAKPKPLGVGATEMVQPTRVELIKARHTGAGNSTDIVISSERGIDNTAELIDFAREEGMIHLGGSWYHVYDRAVDWTALKKSGDDKEETHGYLVSLQGEGSLKAWLEKEELYNTLSEAIQL